MSTRESLGIPRPRPEGERRGAGVEAAPERFDELLASGDWDTAVTELRTAIARQTVLPPALLWRFGSLLYLRGETREALAVLSSQVTAETPPDSLADWARVRGWLSTVRWSLGDTPGCQAAAEQSLRFAHAGGDPGARATAHVAMAMAAASHGDRIRNLAHYRQGLRAAVEAGDLVQQARIHANLSSKALGDGDLRTALAEAEASLDVGAHHGIFVALAHTNRAEALLALGRLDEARADAVASVEGYDRHGSTRGSAPLRILAAIDLERGDLTRARLGFDRAIRTAHAAGDVHNLVLAQIGLARTVLPTEPQLAERLVAGALEAASGLERAAVLATYALVVLGKGDRHAAAARAAEAEAEARRTDDLTCLAESLELRAVASRPVGVEQLRAAVTVWRETGGPIGRLRAERLLAHSIGDAEGERVATDRLAHLGVSANLGVGLYLPGDTDSEAPLAVVTLGRFVVLRYGEPVPLAAWQSRKARDLFKLLIARPGRSITRDLVTDSLWPGEAAGAGNRLSVALSTLRKVLDPLKVFPADHFVMADGASLWLRVEHVSTDLTHFLALAHQGETLAGRGDWPSAEPVLVRAQALYAGEFLEEDRYADWTVDCRERAHSAALVVSRLLARAAIRRADDEVATRHLLRLLELDPYDEQAWLALIGAQLRQRHHGEARRQHASYTRRMRELGVPVVALAEVGSPAP